MATQQDVLKNFVASLDKTNLSGTAAVDEAVKACSSFTSYSDLINHFLADRNNSASGEDFLKRYCGINLDNDDTGAITGSDADGSFVKTAESVVPEVTGDVSIYPPSNSFSYKGLTVNVPSAISLTENQKNIVAGLYTWWLKAGLDLVEETYGFSFEDSDATFKSINVDFNMGNNTHLVSYFHYTPSGARTTNITLHINSNFYSTLKNYDLNGSGNPSDIPYLDRELSMDLTHMLLMAKTNYEFELPSTIGKGLSALTNGINDYRQTEILELSNDTQKLVQFSQSNSRVDTGIYDTNKYDSAMGYMLLRYLAKQAADVETAIPADAFEYNGHSYYLYSGVAQTWEEAQAYCQARGGHLAVINDDDENTALFNYMKSSGYSSAYFGFSDASQEGNWQWVDGTPVNYTYWAHGEPSNDYGRENYGMFYWRSGNEKWWNDGDFLDIYTDNGGQVFICEWDDVRDDVAVEIDEATALEVINLFQGMDAASKKTALEENLKTLESLKSLVEGDKKIETVDEQEDGSEETHFTDSKNWLETVNTYYDDDAAPLITEYTKYLHDSSGRIVYRRKYARDSAGNIVRDSTSGQSIRVFELDVNGHRIPIENNSAERKFHGLLFSTASDIASVLDSLEKIVTGKVSGTKFTMEIANLSSAVTSLTGNIRDFGGFDKAGTIAPIASAVLGLTGSIISLTDGVEPKEVVECVQKTLQTSIITSKYVLAPEFASTKIGTWLGGNTFVNTYITPNVKPLAEKLNANALKANLVASVVLGLAMGGVQYFKSNEQYQLDGLKDSLATKNKWIDSLTAGIKTFYSTITGGLDDALWSVLSSKVQGINGKNYMELFGDFVKLVFLNQYTDPKGDEDGYMENTKNGRNIYGGGGNDSINNKASSANIYGGVGKDLIFCAEGTNRQYIDGGNDNDHIALYGSSNEVHGGLGDDQIDIFGDSKNPAGGNYVLGEAGNDHIWIGNGKSRKKSSVANSISGGAGDDVIFIDQTRTANIIFYENGDGDDEIFGYDSNDQIRINKIAYTTQIDGDDVKIIVGSGSMTLYDAKDKKLNITRTDVEIMPTGMTADKARTTLTLNNKFKAQNVYLENYGSSFTKVNASGVAATQGLEIVGNSSGNSIKGGKGDYIISGEDGNDTIYGGSGNDIISGGIGSNTLSGGAGKDIFVYTGGDDFITDYKAGDDKIKLVSAEIISSDVLGSNLILTTSAGNITVKSAKNSQITVIDKNDSETTQLYGRINYSANNTAVTLTSAFTGTLQADDYPSTVKKIDAASTSKAIQLYGNAQANTIFGGKGADTIFGNAGADKLYGEASNDSLYGGAGNDSLFGEAGNDKLFGEDGNDTLSGGAGSDTLTGGAGKDVFVYGSGDGKNTITDYAENQDKIKITSGEISSYSFSGSNVVFTVGNGTLTVQNGKGRKITITDAKNKTTMKTYSSGRNSNALWFMEGDDNFVTSAAELRETFRDGCSESAIGDFSASSDVMNLTAEFETAVPTFSTPEKNQ